MRLSDAEVRVHLKAGGRIFHPTVLWAYAALLHNQLWWFDRHSKERISIVEGYTELASWEWIIVELGKEDAPSAVGWGDLHMDPTWSSTFVLKPNTDFSQKF